MSLNQDRAACESKSNFAAPARCVQAEDIAAAITYAATQPDRVAVNEMLIRPNRPDAAVASAFRPHGINNPRRHSHVRQEDQHRLAGSLR